MGFQNILGLGGAREPLAKVTEPTSKAGLRFSADIGPNFGPVLRSWEPVQYLNPCFVNNFWVTTAFLDLNSPCCSRDWGLTIHPVWIFMKRGQFWRNFRCKNGPWGPKSSHQRSHARHKHGVGTLVGYFATKITPWLPSIHEILNRVDF